MTNTPRDRLEAAAHDAESNLQAHLQPTTPGSAAQAAPQADEQSRPTLHHVADRARQQFGAASHRAVGYVRAEPAWSVLMAAAAGALLFALARGFSSRSR
jgi:ElaB/YqjD/DUF883 family membrane-anchored ribosome-binding protein